MTRRLPWVQFSGSHTLAPDWVPRPNFNTGFKETAFLYAVSSAALTHTLARACSAGRLERCTCDDSPGMQSRQAWQWGVCGDNLKYSTKFLSHFLGPKRGSKDLRARADAHNTHVGIKVCGPHQLSPCPTAPPCSLPYPVHQYPWTLHQRPWTLCAQDQFQVLGEDLLSGWAAGGSRRGLPRGPRN